MIRSCSLSMIVLALTCSISLASAEAPQPGRGVKVVARTSYGPVDLYRDSWALVVGINDYANWPKLRFARADAEAVARMLTEKLGFPKEHVFTLYDRQATKKAVTGILEDRFANHEIVGPEDRVFIYFSGHGDTKQERGYLMPVDAERETNYSAMAISMQELKDLIAPDRIQAKHVYVVTDACYSGMLFVAQKGAGVEKNHPRYIQEVTRRKARQGLTAGGKEPVSDSGWIWPGTCGSGARTGMMKTTTAAAQNPIQPAQIQGVTAFFAVIRGPGLRTTCVLRAGTGSSRRAGATSSGFAARGRPSPPCPLSR